jgi:hypothetical protein
MSAAFRVLLAAIGAGLGAMLLGPTEHIVEALVGGILVLGVLCHITKNAMAHRVWPNWECHSGNSFSRRPSSSARCI